MNPSKYFEARRLRAERERQGVPRVVRFFRHDIWLLDATQLAAPLRLVVRVVRVIMIGVRGFLRDRCMQQAAALTYLTIFAMPAFLAMMFAVAKGFDAFDQLRKGPIQSFLDTSFPVPAPEPGAAATAVEPSGSERIREVIDQIFEYVENANLKLLGAAGVLFLLYATLKMLGSVEKSLNEIWGVQRARSLMRKFSDYLAIVIVIPVVLLIGTAFTGLFSSANERGEGAAGGLANVMQHPWLTAAIPVLAISLGMTLVLMMLPNTRVRVLPALFGGLLAGVSWQIAQFLFLEFQIGLTRVNAVFSSFAAVPLLLTWIYISWIVLFAGAELSFALQNERLITTIARTGTIDQRFKEAMAPRLAGRVVAAFLEGRDPPDATSLATDIGVSPRAVALVLEQLVEHRILSLSTDEDEDGYLPARDPDTITVLDLLQAMRVEPDANPVPVTSKLDERVDRLLDGMDQAIRSSLHNHTLRELASVSLEAPASRAVQASELAAPEPAPEGEARTQEHPAS